jgi:hypothetical protein
VSSSAAMYAVRKSAPELRGTVARRFSDSGRRRVGSGFSYATGQSLRSTEFLEPTVEHRVPFTPLPPLLLEVSRLGADVFVDLLPVGQVVSECPINLFESDGRERQYDDLGRVSLKEGVNDRAERDARRRAGSSRSTLQRKTRLKPYRPRLVTPTY